MMTNKERTFWMTLPQIDVMEKEPGDVNIQPREAIKLADAGVQLFRMDLDRDSIIPENGQLGPSSFAVVRGVSESEVYRLLRAADGIVYERDR